MEEKLISVIVPVYGVEKYLDRCVESIINQTYKNLEIILVDDGSPDNCPEFCDEWAKKDSRIRAIHKENGGLSDARNAGIKIATGDYIGFVDSDDWIEADMYQILMKEIEKNNGDIAGCEYRRCSDFQKKTKTEYKSEIFERIPAMSSLIDNKIEQVVWNKLYKREIIDNVFFEKGKYHEDEFWSYLVFAKIDRYVAVDYIGYNYFVRADSIMGESYSLKRLDVVEAKCCRQDFLEKNMQELASKGRINLMFTFLYHGQLALKNLNDEEQKKALRFIKKVFSKYRPLNSDLKQLALLQKIWVVFAKVSFKGTCMVRNLLGIGM